MKVYSALVVLSSLLAAVPVSAGSREIVISDSLAAQGEPLNVKSAISLPWKMPKWRVGDYSVVSGKPGLMSSTTKQIPSTDTARSTATGKFSFVLTGKSIDSVFVNAARKTIVDSLHGKQETRDPLSGGGAQVYKCDTVTAVLMVNQDTSETWTLFVSQTRRGQAVATSEAYLSHGERNIILTAVRSPADDGLFELWVAQGFEFFERGQSLCAVQYRGGTFGTNFGAWMRKDLDERLKLVLAAAMTTILVQNN